MQIRTANCVYACVYIHICVYMCVCIYMFMFNTLCLINIYWRNMLKLNRKLQLGSIHNHDLSMWGKIHKSNNPKDGDGGLQSFSCNSETPKALKAEILHKLTERPCLTRTDGRPVIVFVSLVWVFTCFAAGCCLRRPRWWWYVMQCGHHIALLKFNIFWIPNHVWSQRFWLRGLWTDMDWFCPKDNSTMCFGEFFLRGWADSVQPCY